MSWRAVLRSSKNVFRMPRLEALTTQDNLCITVVGIVAHLWYVSGSTVGIKSGLLLLAVFLHSQHLQRWGENRPSPLNLPRPPEAQTRNQWRGGNRWPLDCVLWGFLFPTAWVLGVSVDIMAPCARSAVRSLESQQEECSGPTAQEGRLEGTHFKG